MKSFIFSTMILVSASGMLAAADLPVETFHAYADSEVCARLMLGPINSFRVECGVKTVKNGADPVLVQLRNNVVLGVDKPKMIDKLVGQLVRATGQVKAKDGTMKLQEVSPELAKDIPAGDPARKLIDSGNRSAGVNPKVYEKIRHELAMLPYISEFDFISFGMVGSEVILSGWTVRETNRYDAGNIVKSIEGVTSVVNNIDVLPLGRNDMQIRAGVRARLQQRMRRYFWGNGSDIKIVVKNGDIILLGVVSTKEDSDVATLMCNQVFGVFHVFNLLRVSEPPKKEG